MEIRPKACILIDNQFVYDNAVFYRAKTLASAGYQVTVLAIKYSDKKLSSYEQKDNFSILRINLLIRRLPSIFPLKVLSYLEYIFKIIPVCLKGRFDIYHACGSPDMLLASVILAKLRKAKIIYDTKDFLSEANPGRSFADKINLKMSYIIEKWLIKKADKVIASSDSIADKFQKTYGVELPITMRECKPYSRVEHSNKIREKLNIPLDKKIVLYFGNIFKERGLDKLIESMVYIDNSMAVIIGEGDHRYFLEGLAAKLNLSKKVKFLDRVPFSELAEYISSADIGFTSFENSCFNNSYNIDNRLFYYVCCGVPLVCSNNPERRIIVEKYGLGLVFDETDPRDIAIKINQLLEDHGLYAKVKKNAIRAAKTDLNWANESNKLLAIYGSISG